MNLINFFEKISIKKLTGLTIVLALILTVPISVWMVQQETKTTGRAFFEKPESVVSEKHYGAPSAGQPKINLVWPFLGKVGDAVLIQGENFGDNPQEKSLAVGGLTLTEAEISQWTPTLIEFKIPSLPSGVAPGSISLSVAGQNASWDFPFIVYDRQTPIQVKKDGRLVTILNGPEKGKVEFFFSDGQKMESPDLSGFFVPEGKTIVSLLVKDQNNQPLPFFVEPAEFGF